MPSRARHTKSRFGCYTCRARKVRCDETWPECQKCTTTGRKCDGPSQQKFVFVQARTSKVREDEDDSAGPSLAIAIPSSGGQLTPSETRAFQYFVLEVAPCLAGSQDETFWTYFVPRICEANAAVKYAILTISCMYEHPFEASQLHTNFLTPTSQARLRALQWHSQSIRGFRAGLSNVHDLGQAEIALMSCILLASIEYVQNNVVNASKLLNHGYSIASMVSTRSGRTFRDSAMIRDVLAPILVRQTVHMTIFGYEPPQSWSKCFYSLVPASVTSIESLPAARERLYSCLWKAMAFLRSALPLVFSPQVMSIEDGVNYQGWQQHTLDNLDTWHRDFQTFQIDNATEPSPQGLQAKAAMQMYFYVAYVWVKSCLDMTHMLYENETYHFEQIIKCAEQVISIRERMYKSSEKIPPAFTFDMCVIPPLFFTGWHCRHPLLRRTCVSLLQRAPKQEGLFVAEWMARAIEQIIILEESKALREAVEVGRWDGVTLPSSEMRFQHVTIHHEDYDGRKVSPRLVCVRKIRKGVKAQVERLTVELYRPK